MGHRIWPVRAIGTAPAIAETLREMAQPARPRILVAEDDPVIASLLTDVLEFEGFDVTVAPDGEIALASIERRLPDALVLDLMMPKVTGMTVLRRVRERTDTRMLPVLVLTARADAQTIWDGWESGCDFYLTKPFRPAELVEALDRLLARTGRAETA